MSYIIAMTSYAIVNRMENMKSISFKEFRSKVFIGQKLTINICLYQKCETLYFNNLYPLIPVRYSYRANCRCWQWIGSILRVRYLQWPVVRKLCQSLLLTCQEIGYGPGQDQPQHTICTYLHDSEKTFIQIFTASLLSDRNILTNV